MSGFTVMKQKILYWHILQLMCHIRIVQITVSFAR